jgi:dienelactone hydrolase
MPDRRHWFSSRMKLSAPFLLLAARLATAVAPAAPLPQTAPLDWPEADLSARLMDGAHRFVERKIAEAPAQRASLWARDFSSAEAYAKSVEPNRARLATLLGAAEARWPAAMERYGDEENPAVVAETARYRVSQVRWPVLEGLWGCGLLVEPKGASVAGVVVVPDAGQAPEQLLGLIPGMPAVSPVARRLAENGFTLLLPLTISREKLRTDDMTLHGSDQTQREWIYRQAYHMGRHVIGYEVQMVRGAVDWLRRRAGKIGVCGHAEGGLTAFHTAALDTRVDAALVSGYFDNRQRVWAEPIYRNVWGLLREFGDAEIAGLILPRTLIVEHSPVPEITGHKGEWRTPEFASVRAEVARIATGGLLTRPSLVRSDSGAYSEEALRHFTAALGVKELQPLSAEMPVERRRNFYAPPRHERMFRELESQVQRLVQRSERVRDQAFLFEVMPELAEWKWSTEPRLPTHAPEKFIAGAKRYREQFRNEAMGRFDEPLQPFNARTRVVKETEKWTAHDVVLDVYPEFFAWGLLVVPKDVKPGERRPVVVVQHGRDGLPRNLLDGDKTGYRNVAATLAERGFITFAPHNLYRGEDRYRWLNRKANTVQATLFSFITASHDQILRWLETQPFVDGGRIGFYGLSYGGETAVRVPPLLDKYALSICAGDFNQWTRKVASTDQEFSFMRTIEWEMPYWNLGHTFDYAEMAYLMIPRPFMVERGHLDLVGRDQWVAHEYAKVRWLYAQLGLADRTEIEFFQGGHAMRQEGTLDFLHRHLRWPKPADQATP